MLYTTDQSACASSGLGPDNVVCMVRRQIFDRLHVFCLDLLIYDLCSSVTDDSEEWACEDETLSPSNESQ